MIFILGGGGGAILTIIRGLDPLMPNFGWYLNKSHLFCHPVSGILPEELGELLSMPVTVKVLD